MQRDTYLDSLKFVLMALVIFGHCIQDFPGSVFLDSIYQSIYIFHMPLFIFISGYFSKNTDDPKKVFTGILKISETLLLISIVWYTFEAARYGYDNIEPFYMYIIVPKSVLWYLQSLCSWKIISFLALKVMSKKRLLFLSVIICLSIGFANVIGPGFSLSRTYVFLPFYILGMMTAETHIARIRKINKSIPVLSFIILFLIFWLGKVHILSILFSDISYSDTGFSIAASLLLRALFLVAATYYSICFIALCPNSSFLSKYGKNTLLLYVSHPFLIIIFVKIVFGSLDIYPGLLVLAIEFTLITTVLCLTSNFKAFNYILNPVSTLLSKRLSYS